MRHQCLISNKWNFCTGKSRRILIANRNVCMIESGFSIDPFDVPMRKIDSAYFINLSKEKLWFEQRKMVSQSNRWSRKKSTEKWLGKHCSCDLTNEKSQSSWLLTEVSRKPHHNMNAKSKQTTQTNKKKQILESIEAANVNRMHDHVSVSIRNVHGPKQKNNKRWVF